MTLNYLLDTDWVIHWLNGHAAIGERLNEAKDQGIALSVVSLAELYEGVYYSTAPEANERQLMNFLEGVTIHERSARPSSAEDRRRRGWLVEGDDRSERGELGGVPVYTQ